MTYEIPSGFTDYYCAITYSLVSRAYVYEKYDKSDKSRSKTGLSGFSTKYVGKYPDNSDRGVCR